MTTNLNDDFITRALLEDIKAQAEKAKTQGVSAYLEEPKQRRPTLRPNERFLRNTIASVEHSNRRLDEKEMWARRESQMRGEGRSGASSPGASPSPSERGQKRRAGISDAPTSDRALGGDDEEELERMLRQRRVRGRGGCGPRVGSAGPSLSDENHEDERKARAKRDVGPLEPGLLRREGSEGSSSSGSSGSSDSDSESEERRRKRKRKEKKRKKEKRKRRKKEEKKRKEKTRRRRRRSPSSSRSR